MEQDSKQERANLYGLRQWPIELPIREYEVKEELTEYQTAVRRCPSEVLIAIFEYYLEENPRLTRVLLRVCRHWYRTVISTPIFWTRLPVVFRDIHEDFAKHISHSLIPWASACIERSNGLPLDVIIDIGELELSPYHSDSGMSAFYEAISIGKRIKGSEMGQLINLMVGTEGKHMLRWRTLNIVAPLKIQLISLIMEHLNHPAPILTHLTIRGAGDFYDQDHQMPFFPAVSSLQHVDIDSLGAFSKLGSFASIQYLAIRGTNMDEICRIDFLDRASSLTTLELECDKYYDPNLSPTNNVLSHASLDTFSLKGNILPPIWISFDLPGLQRLHLEPYVDGNKDYPQGLNPKVVFWAIHPRPAARWRFRSTFTRQGELEKILEQYSRIERLDIRENTENALHETIKNMSNAGTLSTSLHTICIMDEANREIRRYDIKSILG